MQLGLGLGLTRIGGGSSLAQLLFSANEPGFTFEPWDISTLYQDRAGTTPVTAAGQSVGLRLSKDQGLRQGPELVTNGDFSAGTTGWTANTATLSDNSGRLQIVSTGGNQGTSQIVPTSIGKWYSLSVTIISANANYNIGYGTGFALGNVYDSGQLSGARTFTAKIFGTGTSQTFWFFCQAAGTYIIDNISVRELAGNHEVAVSDAKRGVYGWMPKTGRRNIEQYTDDLTNAVWSKGSVTVAATSDIDPLGSVVSLITISGAGDTLTQTITVGAGDAVTMSRVLKRGSHDWVRFTILNGANEVRAWFNLATGAVGTSNVGGTGVLFGATVANLGGGYYRCTLSGSIPATTVYSMIVASAVSDASFSRAAVSSTRYQSANQSEIGFVATAYQRVVSQYDITEAGVPTCYYVQADGVDDAYVTPTITPNTDKVQVFAGVQKLSDATRGIFAEFSASIALNNGGFALTAPDAASATSAFESKGTVLSSAVASSLTAPITSVLSAVGDIAADTATLRRNGVQVATSATDQGTGNYLAYPAYIYGRGGTTLPFNGLDFGHAVRFGPNLDAATIARAEALIARNTPGVTL